MSIDANRYLEIKDGAVWGIHLGRREIVIPSDVCSAYKINTFRGAVEFLKGTRPHLCGVKFYELEQSRGANDQLPGQVKDPSVLNPVREPEMPASRKPRRP